MLISFSLMTIVSDDFSILETKNYLLMSSIISYLYVPINLSDAPVELKVELIIMIIIMKIRIYLGLIQFFPLKKFDA